MRNYRERHNENEDITKKIITTLNQILLSGEIDLPDLTQVGDLTQASKDYRLLEARKGATFENIREVDITDPEGKIIQGVGDKDKDYIFQNDISFTTTRGAGEDSTPEKIQACDIKIIYEISTNLNILINKNGDVYEVQYPSQKTGDGYVGYVVDTNSKTRIKIKYTIQIFYINGVCKRHINIAILKEAKNSQN